MIKSFEEFLKESKDLFVPRNMDGRQDKLIKELQERINKYTDKHGNCAVSELDFADINLPSDFKFPEELTVDYLSLGTQIFEEREIEYKCELPKIIRVRNELSVNGIFNISKLCEKLILKNGCEVHICNCKNLKTLSDELVIDNDSIIYLLEITDCPILERIPEFSGNIDSLSLGGNISNLRKFPNLYGPHCIFNEINIYSDYRENEEVYNTIMKLKAQHRIKVNKINYS